MDLQQAIQTFGIAAVLAFVLIRLEARLVENTQAIDKLTLQLALLVDRATRVVGEVRDELRHGNGSARRPGAGPES